MKLKVKKNVILEALNNVSRAISTKNIIPILSGIKMELHRDKLILTASDNDITIQTTLEKSNDLIIESTGSVVIKGKYILDIVRKIDSEFINIEVNEDKKIIIYTDNSNFNLNGINVDEYPDIDLSLSEEFFKIKSDVFKSIILQTNYACSLDEARVVLTGVNMKINSTSFECSATDSYRLALKKIKLNSKNITNSDIIIPSRNLNELLKILPYDEEVDINVYLYNTKIIFVFNNIVFQSRLINGNYPNTKNLIPSDSLFELKLNRNEFYNMIDRASVLNNDRDNNIITLEIKDKVLKLVSMSLEIGKVEETINVDCNENIKISFSGRYMMDALKTMKSEDIIIIFVGEIKPILLTESDNKDLTCLILPIRTY